jgi:iron complex outermembrane recepter protein
MRLHPLIMALAAAYPYASSAQSVGDNLPVHQLGTVTVQGVRPTSLPTQIPTVFEGVNAEQIAKGINATDASDALKYLPSLNVRKRYIADFNHAVLASRASGTGNSARSMVFADGIALSNLLGNGAGFTPRWGLVTPSEIERVDVLYGPFSAAYSGNSVGAVVDYVTKMPQQFEAHVKLGGFTQRASETGASGQYGGYQGSAAMGSKSGDWSWFVDGERLNNSGQPLSFANRLVSAGTVPTAAGVVVSGAITGATNPQNQPWVIVGATGQSDTLQDHVKAKLAYDITPTVRASYTFGAWDNTASANAVSYLRNAAGATVYSGPVIIGGKQYSLTNSDINTSRNEMLHTIHGLSVKSHTKGVFDWDLTASLYDYTQDISRAPTVALPAAQHGGAGRITDQDGTGWNTLSLKGTLRASPSHTTEFGVQRDAYQARTLVSDTDHWISGAAGARFSSFNGNTQLQSLWAQDYWRFADTWNATLGARFEQWRAYGGQIGNAAGIQQLAGRSEQYVSPKAALAFQLTSDWALKASIGRAVRMPTAAELYQGSITGTAVVNNNPNLKPEKSVTTELSAEHDLANGSLRITAFNEQTQDALYSQTNFSQVPTVTNIQNVGRIHTTGLELAFQATDVGIKGLDLSASATYADSVVRSNPNNPATVGKRQIRVPDWRATFWANYRANEQWTASMGVRYSGKQYGQLDNSDTNSYAYLGFSPFLVVDLRAVYQYDRRWRISAGVDNLSNNKYWAFHPYPQRTFHAELKYDLN